MTFLVDGTLGGTFPSWTTATRPASPAVGQMGYNTTTGQFDSYTTNGWVSVATSATAPTSGPAFNAYNTTTQSVTTSVWTKVTLGAEQFDTNSNFATSRFTPTVAGYYQFNGSLRYTGSSFSYALVAFYKNGAAYAYGTAVGSTTAQSTNTIVGSELISCNGSTDYVEMYGLVTATSPVFDYANDTANCRFSGFLARTA